MSRYHINPDTGNPGVCRATKSCPFGDLEKDHYASKIEARKVFEKRSKVFNDKPAVAFPKHLTPELIAKIPVVNGKSYQEYWNEKFSVLTEPAALVTAEVVRSSMGDPDFGRPRGELTLHRFDSSEFDPYDDEDKGLYPADDASHQDLPLVASIYTRNGGGNRECWCEKENEDHSEYKCTAAITDDLEDRDDFIRSWDDDFDQTYATFMFRIDETKEILEAVKSEEKARQQRGAKTFYEAIKDKTYSPLVILPPNAQTQAKLREIESKLVHLRTDYREKTKNNRPWDAQSPVFPNKEGREAFQKVMDTPFHEWDYRKMETYCAATRTNNAQRRDLVVKQEAAKSHLKKIKLYDKLIAEIDAGTTSATALEILGGKDKIKQAKNLEERAYDRACEPITAMKKKWKLGNSFLINEEKLTKEAERLKAAVHWPGQPGRMPEEFKV